MKLFKEVIQNNLKMIIFYVLIGIIINFLDLYSVTYYQKILSLNPIDLDQWLIYMYIKSNVYQCILIIHTTHSFHICITLIVVLKYTELCLKQSTHNSDGN